MNAFQKKKKKKYTIYGKIKRRRIHRIQNIYHKGTWRGQPYRTIGTKPGKKITILYPKGYKRPVHKMKVDRRAYRYGVSLKGTRTLQAYAKSKHARSKKRLPGWKIIQSKVKYRAGEFAKAPHDWMSGKYWRHNREPYKGKIHPYLKRGPKIKYKKAKIIVKPNKAFQKFRARARGIKKLQSIMKSRFQSTKVFTKDKINKMKDYAKKRLLAKQKKDIIKSKRMYPGLLSRYGMGTKKQRTYAKWMKVTNLKTRLQQYNRGNDAWGNPTNRRPNKAFLKFRALLKKRIEDAKEPEKKGWFGNWY